MEMNCLKVLVLFAVLAFAVVVRGQGQIKFCFNDGELIGEKWREADGVSMEDVLTRGLSPCANCAMHGRRIDGQPGKGVYIEDCRKVVVK
jgi:hypothetical protein